MNESTPPTWVKVTWPDSAGGVKAGSVSRQYDTRRYKPYRLSPCDSRPLYEGHRAGWCGAVLPLQATAMATPRAPNTEVMRTDARRVMRASYRAPGRASRPAARCASGCNRNRWRADYQPYLESHPRVERQRRATAPRNCVSHLRDAFARRLSATPLLDVFILSKQASSG